MEDATVVSSYRNVGCGDGYRIYLKIQTEDGAESRITDASYTTTGCGFGLVALAMATDWAKGKTVAEAERVTPEDIESLFGFPERRKNYPQSACEALKKAVEDYRSQAGIKEEDRVTKGRALARLESQGHLRGENLSQVVLEGADLHGVDLSGANLTGAYLQNCNLTGANLKGARLRGAYLNNAVLEHADLRNADIRWAKLTGAKVDGAQFDGAQYDIGTRLDQSQMHLFRVMERVGRDSYTEESGRIPSEAAL
ncbi:MAG: pentapeptide repeat-containing protein [Spirochaetia bacterium]|nr:pentapeptide repeat-containing protein [Spirochaetia bacterium]